MNRCLKPTLDLYTSCSEESHDNVSSNLILLPFFVSALLSVSWTNLASPFSSQSFTYVLPSAWSILSSSPALVLTPSKVTNCYSPSGKVPIFLLVLATPVFCTPLMCPRIWHIQCCSTGA